MPGTLGDLADAQGAYGNLFQLNYTRDNQDAAKELVERAGFPTWKHLGRAELRTGGATNLEPSKGLEAAQPDDREAAFNSLTAATRY